MHGRGGWLFTFCTAITLAGCIGGLFRRSAGYDQRPLVVQTVSLFNQRVTSRLANKSWRGDWILRRDRLDLVDGELRNTKPDLFIVQEMMAKVGSTAESDRRILSAGSLADYDWVERRVEAYDDTQEIQSMGFALGVPYKFLPPVTGERDLWLMGFGGYLAAAAFMYEGQPVTVFNVQMPTDSDRSLLWYGFIQERVLEWLKRTRACPRRVVLGGLLPGDEGSQRFAEFLRTLHLKDASSGYCQIANRCFTATPTNDLYMATVGDESPTRVDRIYVHESALVYVSRRTFEESDPSNRYARTFGLSRLWPTQRFGWLTQIRLGKCSEYDLEEAFGG